MPTLYVTEPGSRVEKEYGRILVTKNDDVLLRVPVASVTHLVLVGRVGVTTPAMHALLTAGRSLSLVARSGKLLGQLLPPEGKNLPLRQAQYRRNDDPRFCLELARAIVAGKIRNQRVLSARILRRDPALSATLLTQLDGARKKAMTAESLSSLLGIEGSAARAFYRLYFQVLREAVHVERRQRRPPRDPANALLSLGYTFLGHAAMAALQAVGLDPHLGYFHAEKYGRPALALDLIEEFRSVVVDSLTLTLLKRKTLQASDFEPGPGGSLLLRQRALRTYIRKFSKKLDQAILVRTLGRKISYRKLLEVQARKLAHVIEGKAEKYVPFQAR